MGAAGTGATFCGDARSAREPGDLARRRPDRRGRQRSRAGTAPGWPFRPGLHGPAVQHRARAVAPHAEVDRRRLGARVGFGGRRYRSRLLQSLSYDDTFADYLGFLEPRLRRTRDLLAPHGTLYFHIDYREAHYCKLLLDEVFGRDAFLNELIWAYDYGAKPRRRWPAKHDTILVYVRTPGAHHFDADAVDREPYMAPGLVGAREGRSGQAPHGRVVSHDRAHQRAREDRLPHPEARGRAATDGGSVLACGRVVPGPVRGVGHARRGVPGAGTPVRADRPEPGGGAGHARAPGPAPRRPLAPAARI